MPSLTTSHRPPRSVAVAAARISGAYGLSVTALFVLLVLWDGEWVGNVAGVLGLLGRTFAATASIVLIALWLLRRLGLHVLWLGLIAVWIYWPLRWIPVGVLAGFVFWSMFALPLYALSVLGFPDPVSAPARPGRIYRMLLVLSVWLTLLVVTLAVIPAAHLALASATTGMFDEPPDALLAMARPMWGPVPFLIALDAMARIGLTSGAGPLRATYQ
jgi:hypothetical protein